MTIKAFIERNPVMCYVAIVFAISWGSVLVLGAPYGMPTTKEKFDEVWLSVLMLYLLGPITAGLLLTGLLHGRAGLREVASRLVRWRVEVRWYGIALLTAPILVMVLLIALSLTSSDFLPDIVTVENKANLVLTGIMVGFIFGGLAEEAGWTGFVVPQLRARNGILATGVVVGLIWAIWHILPTYWASGETVGVLSLDLFLPPFMFYMGVLVAYRVLMVWVHDRTNSLFVVMLMHASLTASTLFIFAPAVRGMSLFGYYVLMTVAMWAIVGAIGLKNRWHLTRQGSEPIGSQTQRASERPNRATSLLGGSK